MNAEKRPTRLFLRLPGKNWLRFAIGAQDRDEEPRDSGFFGDLRDRDLAHGFRGAA